MKKIMMILMVAAFALPTMAQTFGNQEQPSVQFQSTSTLQGSGSTYSANPSLNADGTAASPARSGSGPKRVGGLPTDKPTHDVSDTGNTPVGDAVLPLMLMALAFGGVIYLRRRRRA